MTRTPPGHDATGTSGRPLAKDIRCASAVGELLRVDVRRDPEGTTTLQVIGEIDLATSPLLRSRAMNEFVHLSRRLVLDLRRVDFLGSAGLAVLIEIRGEALRRDVALQLVTTSRAVLRPLIATGLIELFDVDPGDRSLCPPRQGRAAYGG